MTAIDFRSSPLLMAAALRREALYFAATRAEPAAPAGLATGRYTCQVNLVDETGRKFAFARTEIVVLPAQKPVA